MITNYAEGTSDLTDTPNVQQLHQGLDNLMGFLIKHKISITGDVEKIEVFWRRISTSCSDPKYRRKWYGYARATIDHQHDWGEE